MSSEFLAFNCVSCVTGDERERAVHGWLGCRLMGCRRMGCRQMASDGLQADGTALSRPYMLYHNVMGVVLLHILMSSLDVVS